MKKLAIAAAAALAMGSASLAHAAATIQFDRDGAGGVGAIAVDTFDWLPGNSLAMRVFSTAPVNGGVTFELVVQGKLGSFVQNTNPLTSTAPVAGTEFTFEARFFETATGLGTGLTNLTPRGDLPSSFRMFYDTTADADNITGLGFGDGLEILRASLVSGTGFFVDQTALNPTASPIQLLDQVNADDQNGTLTRVGNGSTSISLNVDFADPNFFKSLITQLVIDMQDTTNAAVPFLQADPSNLVLGETPYYSLDAAGQRVNGGNPAASCQFGGQSEAGGAPIARCDLHLQTDASTSFNPTQVPEPGSLALLGLGLAGLGFARRRASK